MFNIPKWAKIVAGVAAVAVTSLIGKHIYCEDYSNEALDVYGPPPESRDHLDINPELLDNPNDVQNANDNQGKKPDELTAPSPQNPEIYDYAGEGKKVYGPPPADSPNPDINPVMLDNNKDKNDVLPEPELKDDGKDEKITPSDLKPAANKDPKSLKSYYGPPPKYKNKPKPPKKKSSDDKAQETEPLPVPSEPEPLRPLYGMPI